MPGLASVPQPTYAPQFATGSPTDRAAARLPEMPLGLLAPRQNVVGHGSFPPALFSCGSGRHGTSFRSRHSLCEFIAGCVNKCFSVWDGLLLTGLAEFQMSVHCRCPPRRSVCTCGCASAGCDHVPGKRIYASPRSRCLGRSAGAGSLATASQHQSVQDAPGWPAARGGKRLRSSGFSLRERQQHA
jgi:hypothetical protein